MNPNACLVMVLVMCGCSSTPVYSPVPPPSEPKAKIFHLAFPKPSVAAPIAPRLVQPPSIRIAWDHPGLSSEQQFEVWATDDLEQPFTLRTTTLQNQVAIVPGMQEFFAVRVVEHGVTSDWFSTAPTP